MGEEAGLPLVEVGDWGGFKDESREKNFPLTADGELAGLPKPIRLPLL